MGDAAPNNDDDLGELDPEEEQRFARFFERRQEEERRKAERSKAPKDFGEAMERIADRVIEKLDERAAERRRAADDDEPPAKGSSGKGFMSLLGG